MHHLSCRAMAAGLLIVLGSRVASLAAQVPPRATVAPTTGFNANNPLVIRHVTIVDGVDSLPHRDMILIVIGRHITALGREGSVAVPRHAVQINGRGLFAIPGLWDMHVHLTTRDALQFYLEHGITSIRDMGSEIAVVKPWRDSIAAGTLFGPRIKTAGPILETPESIQGIIHDTACACAGYRVSVAGPERAQHVVDSIAALGADFLKARTYASVETYRAIVAAARRRGIMFAGHPPFGLDISPEEASAGQRTFEHGFYPDHINDSMSRTSIDALTVAYRANGVRLVPTLVAWEGHRMSLDSVSHLTPAKACGALPPDLLRETTRRWKGLAAERRATPEPWHAIFDREYRDLATLYTAGIPLLPGTDVPAFVCPDIALNEEIELFVDRIGMTPLQALRSATVEPARLFDLQDSLGTIERRKLADIVLLDANPLTDIHNVRRVRGVIANGVYHPRASQPPKETGWPR